MKKKQENELKAVSIMKRTCSDINQLYGELSAELSEEYLNDDNCCVSGSIKNTLEVINKLHDDFLIKTKDAISSLSKAASGDCEENKKDDRESSIKAIEDGLQVLNEEMSDLNRTMHNDSSIKPKEV